MTRIGELERVTQDRVIRLLSRKLGYHDLGNWIDREGTRNIDEEILRSWLQGRGVPTQLINNAVDKLNKAAALGDGRLLYDANQAVYSLLRYGVKVELVGQHTQTVWLIDWAHPEQNDFAVAEEVSVVGKNKKRPDVVLYVNGIALGILELKRSTVSVAEGIRQNLGNQEKIFIREFFSTAQLVMAGNDSEGLRYGVIETREKYYQEWKEEDPHWKPGSDIEKYVKESGETPLDSALVRMLEKGRFLSLIHDFIAFDSGRKKISRPNQFFAIRAVQERIRRREGGIIWHTQGSGKSLTMVWLAKWIRENVKNSRVLIITDRVELDEQIEGVFKGVDEDIYRTQSGADLFRVLNNPKEWLMCSLIHKFGRTEDAAMDRYIEDLKQNLPGNFAPKGEIFVFVDECHRTQSGKLHQAMKAILPNALQIGFTGTPLLRADKQRSVDVFGPYIHTYKYDEAVRDGVVLDLRYEARDIEQRLSSHEKVDQWFDVRTRGLTDYARAQIKRRWGTMQEVLSAQSRLNVIVGDIVMDMETRPRLMDDRGNALLVCSSIYQACKFYELFNKTTLKGKCAIITSYSPNPADIAGEVTGEGQTERLHQFEIYRRMLAEFFDQSEDQAMHRVDEFEAKVKDRFIKEPGQMKLLIVVDKLLTGFDSPPATYLYIDKPMRDHGLFQAICRVNRLDTEDKEYGYIVDYKDLFQSVQTAVHDYTAGAFEDYDPEDVAGVLSDRLEKGHERLEETRNNLSALCEPVAPPHDSSAYMHYFVAEDTTDKNAIRENEQKRLALYKAVSALVRAYASLATEMGEAGYTEQQTQKIIQEVKHYGQVREEVKLASGDYVDMKLYEPAMRHLLDTYIQADDSQVVASFDQYGLVDLFIDRGLEGLQESLPENMFRDPGAMTEAIENNVRRLIIDEQPVNPRYYDKMSELLDQLILQHKQEAMSYQAYLQKLRELTQQVRNPGTSSDYPHEINTTGRRALFDMLDRNVELALTVDYAICKTKRAGFRGNRIKEREIVNAIYRVLGEDDGAYETAQEIMNIVKEERSGY